MYQDLRSWFTVSRLGKFFAYQSLACPRSGPEIAVNDSKG
jgi:hypothetical protein